MGDASRSDRAIAALIGCDHKTVADVRSELESTGEIPQYLAKGGQSGGKGITTGTPNPQPPRTVPEETREAIIQEMMRRLMAGVAARSIRAPA
jgi:hypothetical protein